MVQSHWTSYGQTVVVTGCISTVGVQYLMFFLAKGAKGVAIICTEADNEKDSKLNVDLLNHLYADKVVLVKCDVNSEEGITKAFEIILSTFGQIDLIINSIGFIIDSRPTTVTTTATIASTASVNWQGLWSFISKCIKYMRKDEGGEGGTIFNIVSHEACDMFAHKIEMIHFSQCFAMDFFINTDIRILTLCSKPPENPYILMNPSSIPNIELNNNLYSTVTSLHGYLQRMDLFEYGAPGSIWIAFDNKPAVELTPDKLMDESMLNYFVR